MDLQDIILGLADLVGEGISIVRNRPEISARIVWANSAFTTLTGWSLKEAKDISPLKIHGQHLDADERRGEGVPR